MLSIAYTMRQKSYTKRKCSVQTKKKTTEKDDIYLGFYARQNNNNNNCLLFLFSRIEHSDKQISEMPLE